MNIIKSGYQSLETFQNVICKKTDVFCLGVSLLYLIKKRVGESFNYKNIYDFLRDNKIYESIKDHKIFKIIEEMVNLVFFFYTLVLNVSFDLYLNIYIYIYLLIKYLLYL